MNLAVPELKSDDNIRHVTEGFLKNQKTQYSGSLEMPLWWVHYWLNF